WPFLQEGFVSVISDELFRYELTTLPNGKTQVIKNPHRTEVLENWRRKADKLERDYSKRQGTITGTVNVVVHVLMLKGLKRLDDGALIKEYLSEGSEIDFAVQTTVDSVEFEDTRFKEKPPIAIEDEFPLRTQVFFLGKIHYGCPAEVIAHGDHQLLEIRLLVPKNLKAQEPAFGREIAQDFTRRVRYYPSFVVAKRLGISGLTLSKLTASLHVIGKVTEQRSNLGLNLKFEAKKQKVLGYTRKSKDSGWEYSDKAIQLLQEYKRKFPEFVQGLENMHKDAEDFYDKEVAVDKINEIREWLKSVEVREFERVALEAEQLDKEAIDKIEQAAADLLKIGSKYKKVYIKNIPRHALLKPSHASTRLQDQKFSLGDRVVFVQDSGSVPIAAKGTIVGIERHNIDVVCDSSFMSGSTLGDRCSPYRGMTVPGSALLNLTSPQYQEKNNRANHSVRSHTNAHHGYNWQQSALAQTNNYHQRVNARGNGSRSGAYSMINGNHQNARQIIPRPRAANYSNGNNYMNSNIPSSHTTTYRGAYTNNLTRGIVNGGSGGNNYILRSNNGRGGNNAVAGGHYSKGDNPRFGEGSNREKSRVGSKASVNNRVFEDEINNTRGITRSKRRRTEGPSNPVVESSRNAQGIPIILPPLFIHPTNAIEDRSTGAPTLPSIRSVFSNDLGTPFNNNDRNNEIPYIDLTNISSPEERTRTPDVVDLTVVSSPDVCVSSSKDVIVIDDDPAGCEEHYPSAKKTYKTPILEIKCAICLEPPSNVSYTNCGHIFCRECITQAVKVQKMCSLCRNPLNLKKVKRLQFKVM
ncbi:11047_t:CDS:10, partial [Ambispora leptoticha]